MTEYTVLLPDDETAWEASTPEQREAVFAKYRAFSAALAERGHRVIGGAHLAPSREARIVRRGPDGLSITDGPFTEAAEQLTGYYVIESDDLDDLLQCCGILAEAEKGVEVRAEARPGGAS